jgi:MFS family permease
MILGVLPYFIVTELGATAAILGLIEGAAEAVNYVFRVIAGVVTDKIGRRKPLILIGYGFSSIAKPLFAFASAPWQAFVVRVLDRAGKGTRTSPRDALISDSVSRSKAGRGFGLHRSLDQVGAVLGPVLAFLIIPFIGIRGVFWVSFIPATIALLILIFFVKDIRGGTKQGTAFQNVRSVMNRDFVLLLIVLAIFNIGAFNYSFILLKAGLLGIQDSKILALVYGVLNVATVILGLPSGILADRVGKTRVLLLSYGLFLAASAAGLVMTGSTLYAFLIAFLFGSYLAISETVQRAMIPDFTRPQLKGTSYAVYYMVIGACSFVANAIFGYLWTVSGSSAAFQYSLTTSLLGIIALVAFTSTRRR